MVLLSVLTSVTPLSLFHHHDGFTRHCETHHHAATADACHLRIYHSLQTQARCEHKAHLAEANTDCDYCKFHSSVRDKYALAKEQNHGKEQVCEILFKHKDERVYFTTPHILKGRGPPVA